MNEATGKTKNKNGRSAKQDFADAMISGLRRAGNTAPIRYDAERFEMSFDDEGEEPLNLRNAYDEWCLVTESDGRDDIVRRYCNGFLSVKRCVFPADLGMARPHLRAVVKSRASHDLARLRAEADGRANTGVSVPIGDHLVMQIVYDFPHSLRGVDAATLADWGLDAAGALSIAARNLESVEGHLVRLKGGLWQAESDATYDTGRLLINAVWDDLASRVPGELIVLPLSRCTVVACGSDDAEAMARLCGLARQALKSAPRFITVVPLVRRDRQWQTYHPGSRRPGCTELRDLERQCLQRQYASQAELLQPSFQLETRQPCIGDLMLGPADGAGLVSATTWSAGIATAMPRADLVAFSRVCEGETVWTVETAGPVSWERMMTVVGELLVPVGVYPERYLVRVFPDDKQLRAMGITGRPKRLVIPKNGDWLATSD